jgi:hypothetical protein
MQASLASRTCVLRLLLLLPLGCEAGHVGDPCVPEDEYRQNFSGYSASEVNLETGSLSCQTRICLVQHFQGRVSCPYGQEEAALGLPPDDPRRCRVPGTDGTGSTDAVTVPVSAWAVERPADATVYCSCRCDGPDPNAHYCECPSGYSCEPLVRDFGFGERELKGSYCVKQGTLYDPKQPLGVSCADDPDHPNCPSPPLENP